MTREAEPFESSQCGKTPSARDCSIEANMDRTITALVLGVGGNVSQGILKSLAHSSLRCRVIAACINPWSMGLYTADRAYLSPRFDDPEFLNWLVRVCRTERVDVILTGVEPVLNVLAQHADVIRKESGAVSMVSSLACLAIGNDKLRTCEWLREKRFNYPRFAASDNRAAVDSLFTACAGRLIAKPRMGKGAQGLTEVRDRNTLETIVGTPGYVVQEYLDGPEFTVGCFCDKQGIVRSAVVFQRELSYGTTVRAEAGDFPEVEREAMRIVTALEPQGSCNVQLRIREGQPVCFEINVRFSGTTPMRTHLGFNEVEAAIRHFVWGEAIAEVAIRDRAIAIRYWNEVYVSPEAFDKLKKCGILENPRDYPSVVESYGER